MQDISQKIQQASHSGAKLEVFRDDENYFVRKIVTSDIERNHKAVLKQMNFHRINTPTYGIHAIPVVCSEKKESKLTTVMPYIDGIGGEQVAVKGTHAIAKELKSALDFYLIQLISDTEDEIYPVQDIHSKINSISKKLEERWHLFPDLKFYIKCFRSFCSEDLKLPIGKCHGDLTLSNLKITTDGLMLFDFLECEINSPLQDAAKLIQDFDYGWSFRKEKTSIRLKGEVFCEYAKPKSLSLFERLFEYEMIVIKALTVLRIAPYIKPDDQITISWFQKTMTRINSEIQEKLCLR
ncbi:phosphotransferase [Vibrio parahaemolyticus]|uniref:phosphotransferase n=1 Tax=Vibrio parahaemolyticus TaxID=670 RepID=UPI00040081DD|nr:phosphotransferase [Vibrio parahaemolyticus]HCE3509550.1 phosphotransferase [Vibrio parahaemolyticus]